MENVLFGNEISMNDWKRISKTKYSYRGFDIYYSMKIMERRAVDYMKATKEIINKQGETEKISFEATGDRFEDVKEKMVGKIDDFIKTST